MEIEKNIIYLNDALKRLQMIQLLQSVLKEPKELTVQTYVHLHLMVGYIVKDVIVRVHYAILFMDAISSRVSTNTIYFNINIALYFNINIALFYINSTCAFHNSY